VTPSVLNGPRATSNTSPLGQWTMSHVGQNRNFEGFLVRGAIVREKISHEDQTVFGEALIEAYRLESEVSGFSAS
jgi:hypothetical protein